VSRRNLIILTVVVAALGAFIFFVEQHQPTTAERLERVDRVFADVEQEAIVTIEVRSEGGSVELQKTGDRWSLVEPLDYPADPAAVRSLLQSIAALESDRVLSLDEVDPADYGLDAPQLGVALVDEAGTRFELAVGAETPLGSKRAVRRGQNDEILLCPDGFTSSIDREVDEWRSRDVVDVRETDLALIEIQTSSDLVRAVRVGDRWDLEEPVADLADAEQMRSLVSELNALRISEFLEDGEDGSAPDPETWEYRVNLQAADGGGSVTLELAAPVEGETTIVCRRNGSELIRIPDGIRTRLGKAPILWRSPKVWPFSSFDAGKVEISTADGSITLDKVDGIWRLEDGGEADSVSVRRRLTALADLEVREHDLLQPPTEVMGSVILVLEDGGGAEGLTYTFYAPIEIGGHAAVTVSSRSNVMGVDVAVAETILGDLDELRPVGEESHQVDSSD
jgi:hypothetical protein